MRDEGINDAAIFLMSLGEQEAAEIIKHLAPKEVQKLGEAIAKMGAVPHDKVKQVIEKFHTEASTKMLLVSDTDGYVRSVLQKALGNEKAALLIDRILQGGDVSGIESLKWMDASTIAELLRLEHPQIISAILVHLDFDQAADVLKKFDDRTRNDVILRIATLDGIQPNALKDLNDVLYQVLAGSDKIRKASMGGVKAAAEIINMLGNQHETSVLQAVREHDRDLAQKIMDKMFTFEDLLKLDPKSIQVIIREIAPDMMVVALKGASQEVREMIMGNMATRAAENLREDLESRGPMRISEVEAQQKEVLKIVRKLAEEGQIVMTANDEEGLV